MQQATGCDENFKVFKKKKKKKFRLVLPKILVLI